MKVRCEFCKKPFDGDGEDTVCTPCDKKLIRDQTMAAKALEQAHGARYKCKQCRRPLPLHRARYCEDCFTFALAPEPTPFDLIESYSMDDVEQAGLRKVRTSKQCSKCGQTKHASEFRFSKRSMSGLASWCKPCQTAYEKARYLRDKEVRARRITEERKAKDGSLI